MLQQKYLQRQRDQRDPPCPAEGELPGGENPNQILSQKGESQLIVAFLQGIRLSVAFSGWSSAKIVPLRLQNEGKISQTIFGTCRAKTRTGNKYLHPKLLSVAATWAGGCSHPWKLHLAAEIKLFFPVCPHISECSSGSLLIHTLTRIQS